MSLETKYFKTQMLCVWTIVYYCLGNNILHYVFINTGTVSLSQSSDGPDRSSESLKLSTYHVKVEDYMV